MKIYNSYTNSIEEFKTIKPNEVTMYVCGPTVYNYVHIGNMRPCITFDMVANYFKYLGYKVTYASNFTDVNPKIISAAKELGLTEREVADKFINAYLEDLKNFNCVNIDIHPRVINNLDNIFDFITKLIEKGYAYVNDGDVYFRVRKIKEYGKLSNQNIEDLESGARVEIDEKKEDPLDFALWRKTTEGEQFKSPWGMGIPGWHTECVVMINDLFGDKIDIHGGGIDLKFPHHENEIAQSEALNNNNLANYWMHNGHINVDGVKMSKSLGNFVFAKDFIKLHEPNVVKIAMFKTHYRLPFNITDDLFNEAKLIDDKLKTVLKQAVVKMQLEHTSYNQLKRDQHIEEIMNEDFNTPNLITYLSELIKELNTAIRSNTNTSQSYDKITLINQILGLYYDLPNLTEADVNLYNEWLTARNNKDFKTADELRNTLVNKNIL